jgi:hypothetical protein
VLRIVPIYFMFYVLQMILPKKYVLFVSAVAVRLAGVGSWLQVVQAGDAVGNSFKPSLNQTKLI